MLTSRLDAYISKYGDFCAHDDNDNNDDNDTTDYFTPLAHARGVITKLLIKSGAPEMLYVEVTPQKLVLIIL